MFFFPFLPETRASASPLLSRDGCRCAGTSQPVRRSKAEAGARCHSTGSAAPRAADSEPPAPALLRFTPAEEKRLGWQLGRVLLQIFTEWTGHVHQM